ncbi:MAG: ABC transporter ATP-binding protein [Streptomycetaceae bacterium]|nr:MAG: ABC transporter ATP-binding protein [Streptomycetaceae bacterium]
MTNAVDIKSMNVVRDGKVLIPSLDFSVPSGKITGLLGPSGGGKTTIFRCIVGVQQITKGSVSVLGMEAGSIGLRSKIGYLTQSASIYSDLTCEENLRYFSRILGSLEISVDEMLQLVDLESNRKQLASTLSGGERARLALATALLGSPELLILDEPTVGLDPVLRIELWKLFHQLANQGKTLIVSSHVMDEAERCDELMLLREGKVLATGTPKELKAKTQCTEMEDVFISLVSAQ